MTGLFDFSILRAMRKREKMSIETLSRRSGVSASVISKLERNRNVAEVETLYRLAKVFGMTLTDLVNAAERPVSQRAQAEEYAHDGFHFRRISYANLRCLLVSAPAGAAMSKPELHRDDFELCWVLKGRLRVTLPKEVCELSPGESIQFDALLEHTYQVIEKTDFILIHLHKEKRF